MKKELFKNEKYRNTLIVFAVMSVTAILFSLGEYWDFSDEILKEIIFLCADFILVVLIPFCVYKNKKLNQQVSDITFRLCEAGRNTKEILKVFLIYAVSMPVSTWIYNFIAWFEKHPVNLIENLGAAAIGLLCVLCWRLRKDAMEQAHKLFLCTVMIIGTLFVIILPAKTGISWDDQIHFDRTLSAATLDGPYYVADEMIYLTAWDNSLYFAAAERAEWEADVNRAFENKERTPYYHGDMRHISIVGYTAYAAGTILARGLGLPYVLCFRISKLLNVFVYGLIISFGIKRLKYGKIVAAAIGLIPTNLFMASNYTYDTWLTSFVILGFAYFFAALQRKDEKLSNTEIAIMIGAFFAGCLTKAIYCALMLPLLFMPKYKFASKRQRTIYMISGFTAVSLLMATFAAPIIINGAGTGDARGGSDVNASEQIRFIMSHPLEYLKILYNFLKNSYLTPYTIEAYTRNYAYLGWGKTYNRIIPVIIFLCALTDKTGTKGRTASITISTIIALVIMCCLIPTSMYISFTPVGHTTVNGCQARYLIPLIFPALYVNSFDFVNLKKYRNEYALGIIFAIGLINIISITSVISRVY